MSNKVIFTDILPFALLLIAVSIPFVVERLVFQKRRGVFQWIFWIFVAQCVAIGSGLGVAHLFGPENLIGGIGQVIASLGFIAIGTVPLIILPVALLAMFVWYCLRLVKGEHA